MQATPDVIAFEVEAAGTYPLPYREITFSPAAG